jgi:hypothetical protein
VPGLRLAAVRLENLLGELKVADMWNQTQLGGELSAEELCAMATRNPADALGWSARIGRLREEPPRRVLVTTDRGGSPYRNLIESVERDVQLVAINGQPFYGTARLMKAAGATHDEPIRLGRLRRVGSSTPASRTATWAGPRRSRTSRRRSGTP